MQIGANNQLSGITPEFFARLTAESGCRFEYVIVPRARAELMFMQGEVDILPTANKTEARDKAGTFIPILGSLPALISTTKLSGDPEKILASRKLHVNVVLSYNYGPEYDQLTRMLADRNLLETVSSPDIVARKMAANRVDATIMSTLVFHSAAEENHLSERLHALPFTRWPILPAGMYLAHNRLSTNDFNLLKKLLERQTTATYFLNEFRSRAAPWATVSLTPLSDTEAPEPLPKAKEKPKRSTTQ